MTNETPAQDLRSALEPCPFCGAKKATDQSDLEGVWVEQNDHSEPEYHVHCWRCGARGNEFTDRNRAIAAWNRRAALTQPAENAKGGEVVAWMYDYRLKLRGDDSDWKVGYVSTVKPTNIRPHEPDYHNIRPLYAHPPAAEPVGLREAAQAVFDGKFSTYKARNGRDVGIQGDDGEKVWLVHSDQIFALETALATPARTDDAGVGGDIRETSEYLITLLGKAVRGEIIRDMAEAIGAFRQSVAALKPADATPAGEEKMRRTLEFIRDTDASAKFLKEAAKTTLAAFSTPPVLDEGDK